MNWTIEEKILIQGIDQPTALPYVEAMTTNNIQLLAGIVSDNNNNSWLDIPCFELVTEAIAKLGEIKTSIIFNHPYDVLDAGLEAIDAGIKQIIISTTDIPPFDLCKLFQQAEANNVQILGPNQGGILIPEKVCLGLTNPHLYQKGNIGIINYGHPSLSDELALFLQSQKLGESIIVNLGNSYVNKIDLGIWLANLQKNRQTKQIIIIFSDYFNLNKKNIVDSITNFSRKNIIAYLLDYRNFKSSIYNCKTKIVSDQVPIYQNQIVSPESIKELLHKLPVKLVENHQQMGELINNNLT